MLLRCESLEPPMSQLGQNAKNHNEYMLSASAPTVLQGRGRCRPLSQICGELVALAPDVILASGTAAMAPLLHATRTVPIVFAQVTDPVGAGFVDSLARPGGNTTGFAAYEYGLSVKWLELLKQVAPRVTRVAAS